MRYKIFIIGLLCLSGIKLSAQGEEPIPSPLQQQNIDTEEKLKTRLGVKCTFGGHTFKGSAFDHTKPTYGFGVGMYNIIDLNKNKRLKLQWELNLTFKGSKFTQPSDTSKVFYSKISLSYAEIPVYLSYQLSEAKAKKPSHLLVGGQFSYLFKSNIIQGKGQYGNVLYNSLPFKKYDFSPALGFRQDLGSGISLQFTAKYGLVNIYSNKFDPAVTPPYLSVFPRFKDGSHDAHNLSFELAFLFD